MTAATTLSDLIGIEHSKLGFFQELQQTVTKLQQSNRELEEQRREIAAIIDGITDVMMVLSEDLRILSVNNEFHKLFPEGNPIGRHCYELFRHSGIACPECPAFRSISTNTVCKETAVFRIGDCNHQFEMLASPLKSPGGEENRVLIFKRDVTMEKELQAKYYQAEKMATVGTLATGIAHEVNNPLMAISGYAEGIQRRLKKYAECMPEDVAREFVDYTETIIGECSRCQRIVRSLLHFGHPETSIFGVVSLNDIIRESLTILGYHLKKSRKISLKLELAEDLPFIFADEPRLKQVMLNLVTNAMDALDGMEGVITVRTRLEGETMVVMEVEDTGTGIAPAIMDRLFDPFFTTKSMGKGIGIGLATCYGIIKDHDGDIDIHSVEGEGACFKVTIPIQLEKETDAVSLSCACCR
ncbi:PAS domain-containing protein [Pseudodesulfovibrio sp. F-1]|uniref:histidine kinase n=1 Tax=Pseudodesulfovibrio alkaliphilus TaxID=2661613 RepID=A0A7K1KP71_9BACT|nr:ATP-binding protein [Pseudodesulfovibrio alkaliphilus]MUM77883.1 PAS domain-containing protein [Pseudodesulfovibrio alkaliphilus]